MKLPYGIHSWKVVGVGGMPTIPDCVQITATPERNISHRLSSGKSALLMNN